MPGHGSAAVGGQSPGEDGGSCTAAALLWARLYSLKNGNGEGGWNPQFLTTVSDLSSRIRVFPAAPVWDCKRKGNQSMQKGEKKKAYSLGRTTWRWDLQGAKILHPNMISGLLKCNCYRSIGGHMGKSLDPAELSAVKIISKRSLIMNGGWEIIPQVLFWTGKNLAGGTDWCYCALGLLESLYVFSNNLGGKNRGAAADLFFEEIL